MLGDPVNLVDVLGLWFGWDDLVFSGVGAVGSAVANGSKQVLKNITGNQCGYDITSFGVDTVLGTATGLIPGMKIQGITAGKGSMNAIYHQMVTKFKTNINSNGENYL